MKSFRKNLTLSVKSASDGGYIVCASSPEYGNSCTIALNKSEVRSTSEKVLKSLVYSMSARGVFDGYRKRKRRKSRR